LAEDVVPGACVQGRQVDLCLSPGDPAGFAPLRLPPGPLEAGLRDAVSFEYGMLTGWQFPVRRRRGCVQILDEGLDRLRQRRRIVCVPAGQKVEALCKSLSGNGFMCGG